MNRRAMCGFAAVFVSGLCAANEASVEETLRARWTAAYNSGDAAALGAMYAVDARLQQGYCPAVTGRSAIEAFWRDDLGDGSAKTYHRETWENLACADATVEPPPREAPAEIATTAGPPMPSLPPA